MRPHGRARISRSKPQAQAVCDRCGFRYSHAALSWQFDWEGARLQNLRILVCPTCRDKPQENIRTIIIPPDPIPIVNPRPEYFTNDDNPISGIGWDPANLFSLRGPLATSAFSGTLTGGGGPDAVFSGGPSAGFLPVTPAPFGPTLPFVGGPTKLFGQSATFTPSSTAAGANNVVVSWSATPGAPVDFPQTTTLPGPAPVQQSYIVASAVVCAPVDAAFIGSNVGTTITLWGSSDGTDWTSLASSTTAGLKAEQITITSASVVDYPYHRISVLGDGIHPAAVASVAMFAAGPSAAQTGSELGA